MLKDVECYTLICANYADSERWDVILVSCRGSIYAFGIHRCACAQCRLKVHHVFYQTSGVSISRVRGPAKFPPCYPNFAYRYSSSISFRGVLQRAGNSQRRSVLGEKLSRCWDFWASNQRSHRTTIHSGAVTTAINWMKNKFTHCKIVPEFVTLLLIYLLWLISFQGTECLS